MPPRALNKTTAEFAAIVKRELEARDMTQRDLGEMIGLGEAAVSKRMNDRTIFKGDEVMTILRRFNLVSFRNEPLTLAELVSRHEAHLDEAQTKALMAFLDTLVTKRKTPPE